VVVYELNNVSSVLL